MVLCGKHLLFGRRRGLHRVVRTIFDLHEEQRVVIMIGPPCFG
jgi:hypothetical protein